MSAESIGIPGGGAASWKATVQTAALLPANGNQQGDARIAQDTGVIYVYVGGGWVAATSGGGGSGTVISVGLVDNTGLFNVSGSPVTVAGSLTLASLHTQGANQVLAAPNGSTGTPSFRSLVVPDVPTLSLRQETYVYTLNSTDISNGYISLPTTPTQPSNTLLTVAGGPMQIYGVDYMVVGSALTWLGLGLNGILAVGDILSVESN